MRYFKIIQYALAFGAVRLIPELYWLVYALPAKIFLFLALSESEVFLGGGKGTEEGKAGTGGFRQD